MEKLPTGEVPREGQVSVLVDRQVPGDLPEETMRSKKENQGYSCNVDDVGYAPPGARAWGAGGQTPVLS